ncbi:MAG TPA: DUF1800 domain-containing protein [Pyrinomonadaceae bacterium]|nr:DUF1800 domain-containing protein [Pyrinomonadaceae bacterium]
MFTKHRPRLPIALLALTAFCTLCFGQSGIGSGGPVLLTEANSTRAVALESLTLQRDPFPVISPSLLSSDRRTRIAVFAMNVDLYTGEAANAFTAEAEASGPRIFPLKVESVSRVPGFEGLTQITIRLDELMADAGDVLLRISLRGMTSNRVRIAVGHQGGGPPDDQGAIPTPAPEIPPAPRPLVTPNPYTGPATLADTVRFLEQATWGPTNAEVARVRALGFRAYLDEQLVAPVSSYPTMTLMPTDSNQGCQGASVHDCLRDNYSMYPLQTRFYKNAFYKPDQLRQRVAFALHQILTVSGRDMNQASWMVSYLQTLDRNAFGNFRTLLFETTLNPAMGSFLGTAANNKQRPNENFAREFLQLFSVGQDLLNADGTPQLDVAGNRVPTYDQATISNFARVFTGWYFAPPPAGAQGVINFIDPMMVIEANHDTGAKMLLNGTAVPPGQNTLQDLNAAIDNAFNHPNTGPFISQRLIRQLVTSNPSPAYVERVAAVFANNCAGYYPDSSCTSARGDLGAVVRAILLDPEARGDFKTDPDYGRLREPVLFISNICRAFNARGIGPGINNIVESDGYLNPQTVRMGQDVFRPTTVFGYFPSEYNVPGAGLKGPEFGILSSSTSLTRAGFGAQMSFRSIPMFADADTPNGTFINLTPLQSLADDPVQLVGALDALLMHGTMSPTMRDAITQAILVVPTSDPNHLRNRTQSAVYLVLTSPQYQVQR